MERLRIRTFLRFWFVFGIICGFCFGVAMIVTSLVGGDATVSFFGTEISGLGAGFIGLILGPVIVSLLAVITSPLFYFPFKWAFKLARLDSDAPPEVHSAS